MFSLFIIPILLDILFEILFIWLFQFRFSSNVNPRNWKFNTLSMTAPCITRCKALTCFLGKWNIIYLRICTFNDSLFNLSQWLTLASSLLSLDSVSMVWAFLKRISRLVESVVSSAWIIKSKILLARTISFIYVI